MARISRTTRTTQTGWRVFITPGWVITFLLVISFSYAAFTILSPWQLGKDAQIVNRNNHIEDAFNVDPKPYSDIFTSDGAKSLGGFGAIASLFPSSWDWYVFWKMTAFLSIMLAFMNILPIPALDGGHVLFLLYEMITRRKPSEKFLIRAEYAGFALLIVLLVVANLNDVLRWLGYM